LQVVDRGLDRNARVAILIAADAAVDPTFAPGLDHAVLPLVVGIDLPVKKFLVETLQRGTIRPGDLEIHDRIRHDNAPLRITG
jgi:hypothetical protein